MRGLSCGLGGVCVRCVCEWVWLPAVPDAWHFGLGAVPAHVPTNRVICEFTDTAHPYATSPPHNRCWVHYAIEDPSPHPKIVLGGDTCAHVPESHLVSGVFFLLGAASMTG